MMVNMNYELRDLLEKLSEENGRNTHCTTYGLESKWCISDQSNTEFWKEYCSMIYNHMMNEEEVNDVCLAEIPTNVIPLIQEFVFKYQDYDEDDVENWEPYDDHFLANMCLLYQEMLIKYFNVPEEKVLMVVVMESTNYWIEEDGVNKYILIKVRLQFPNARIDVKTQDDFIRKEMISILRKNNMLSNMNRQPIGDWDNIMCKNIAKTPVLMYGSSSSPMIPKLKELHVWGKISQEMIENNEEPEEISVKAAFNFKFHEQVRNKTIDKNIFNKDIDPEYWLPLYLSIGYGNNTLLLKSEYNKKVNIKITNTDNFVFGQSRSKFEGNDDENLEMASKLLSIISPVRYLQESSWLDIGRSLYHIDRGGGMGLNMWIKHTINGLKDVVELPAYIYDGVHHQSEDIISEVCRYNYDTFGKDYVTMKTLGHFARIDNVRIYNDWHKSWVFPAMEAALSCSETDVCAALYRLFWLEFTFDPRNKRWYEFVIHGWTENFKGTHLSKAISSLFMKKFEETRTILSNQIQNSEDQRFKSDGEITIKKLLKLIQELKRKPFKKRLMEEAEEFFENEKISEYLNKNPNLTGVKNGVLEIVNDDLIFRPAKPEDYISMCAGVPFNTHMHLKHPLVVECMEYFRQVYPDEQLLHYFLKFCASFFKGRNSDKIFAVFTGKGHNSKSMIVKLFNLIFAVYAIKMPVGMLFEKSANSGNATPQLARAKNVKLAIFDEPEDTMPMNKGIIKRLTGGDSFYGRLLNENGGDIEMTFKIMMITNEIPAVSKADEATKDRFKIFPHLGKWIDDPPPAAEQMAEHGFVKFFKKDVNFENRLPVLAPAAMWIFSQYYPTYCKEGLEVPEIVKLHTEEYWKNNDLYGLFIQECIVDVFLSENVRDLTVCLSVTEMYDEFKMWFKSSHPGKEVPGRQDMKNELQTRWDAPDKNGWVGITTASKLAAMRSAPI
jgi:phage/plasmid-associated DNA primase